MKQITLNDFVNTLENAVSQNGCGDCEITSIGTGQESGTPHRKFYFVSLDNGKQIKIFVPTKENA